MEPLDELYLKWLYKQVAVPEFDDRDLTYWKLFRILYQKEFIWFVENDENRIHDGIAERVTFLHEEHIPEVDANWMELGCSMLELMVGLARRFEFSASKGKTHYWFWVILDNIGLSGYSDERRFTKRQVERIDDILNDVIHRNYNSSGLGGFFPLQSPRHDQRDRELWNQMGDYIWEHKLAG
jgi:hypothetical protein